MKNIEDASLTVVGCGIKFMSHLTIEAKTYIKQSQKLLYLINEPLTKQWIRELNPSAESLDSFYFKYELRADSYKAITNHILQTLYQNQHVCVVVYGHPTVFAKPALDAVIQAKQEGYEAKILPGISAEDCLFADLLINPGTAGYQSFEATDVLIRQRQIDPSCHVILWQIGMLGELGHTKSNNQGNKLGLLSSYLQLYYNLNHEICLYTAAQYPGLPFEVKKITLNNLSNVIPPRISTLYIPPGRNACEADKEILKKLGILIKF